MVEVAMENYWDLLLLKELEVVLALEVVPALEVDLLEVVPA